MNHLSLKALSIEVKQKRRNPHQFVLFNKKELEILESLKPSREALEGIKKMKHLFHGELVV